MQRSRRDIIIERRAIRFVGTRGFFFCFAGVTMVAFSAGIVRPGAGILAFPLLAWSPFLFLISLHMASSSIDRIRKINPAFLQGSVPAAAGIAIALYLVAIGTCVIGLNRFGNHEALPGWAVWLFVFLSILPTRDANKIPPNYIVIMREMMLPFWWFSLAVGLAVFALRMLLSIGIRPHQ